MRFSPVDACKSARLGDATISEIDARLYLVCQIHLDRLLDAALTTSAAIGGIAPPLDISKRRFGNR